MTRKGQAGPEAGGTEKAATRHIPVLLAEVLEALDPKAGEIIIDGTFGAGGYTRAILEKADCSVIALDRDPAAIAAGAALVREFSPRLTLIEFDLRRPRTSSSGARA